MPRPALFRSLNIAAVTAEFDGAVCRQTDPDIWFPEVNNRNQSAAEDVAKALCRTCPHLHECLEMAMRDPAMYGVWGGTSRRERMVLAGTRLPA